MPYAFDGDDRSNQEPWDTTEAWRGDVHLPDDTSWFGEATSVWNIEQDEVEEHGGWRGHQHFADWRAWLSSPADSGRRAAVAMSGCIVAFFDKYLKARDDHLLDNPTNAYPELINFVRK